MSSQTLIFCFNLIFNKHHIIGKLFVRLKFLLPTVFLISLTQIYSQQTSQYYQTPSGSNQSATKQEIARFDIKVLRDGNALPIGLVPHVRKGDVLQFRLLDEQIGGVKLDQTAWDWSLVVAYANPLVNKEKEETVSSEIRFRKTGWYRQYSFTVPFDSQPVFFLSPRPGFRGEITKLMNKNFGEISKVGEKMVEISGAYAQINTFLNELQTVVNRSQYGYYPYGSGYDPYSSYNSYNPYGSYGSSYSSGYYSGSYGSSYSYGSPYGYSSPYGSQPGMYNQAPAWLDLAVERLAKSFNVQMPNCWYGNNLYNYNNSYNPYSTTSSTTTGTTGSYSSSYYGSGYPATTTTGSNFSPSNSGLNKEDFVARSQCLARAVNAADFDISVTRMWQQGGVFLAAELTKKYPQLAFYINLAAAAIDFVVRAFQKSPVRIVPAFTSTNLIAGAGGYQAATSPTTSGASTSSYYQAQNYQANPSDQSISSATNTLPSDSKISLYSSLPPSNQQYLTTYPIVIQKWQAEPEAEIAKINTPSLGEACIHAGVNLLKNTNLTEDWTGDNFTRDYKLIVTSENGFRKEFPLRKNLGLGGWELNLSPQDAAQIPKVAMSLEAEITAMRGFDQIKSGKFKLPVSTTSKWEVIPATQSDFAVGGRHRLALRNATGDCLCIQSVVYKPSFGGQFVFEHGTGENSLQISSDNLSAYFEVDTGKFQAGQGTLEVRAYGGETSKLDVKLYPALPEIKDVRIARGDHEIQLTGERLEQLKYVIVNGYRATIQPNAFPQDKDHPQLSTKLAVFDDPRYRLVGANVSLEMGLEDERQFAYPQKFNVLPARPAIVSGSINEVEGISDVMLVAQDNFAATGAKRNPSNRIRNNSNNSADESYLSAGSIANQLVASRAQIFPIDTREISLSVRSNLPDYEFKSENLSIETRIEKSQLTASDYIKTDFEVLDSNSLRIKLYLTGDTHTNLGGRRIQFKIRDNERGDSDWYTIAQTFVRLPRVDSVKCLPEMNGMCEMKGDGMDYVGQVSVDGGKTWYQGEKGVWQAQPTADGKSMVMIPQLINKKLLRIKLRDFPKTEGLFVNSLFLNFSNMDSLANKYKVPP